MTTVSGLEGFDIKMKDAASKIGKKFGTGASVTKSATGEAEITMQGDLVEEVQAALIELFKIPEEAIIMEG